MFLYQLVQVKSYGKYLIFHFYQNIKHRRHGYDMPSNLLLLQEQIDITLWLLVKHYRWVTKGFGEKITLENTEKQQDSHDYMKPTQECMISSADVVSDAEITSWRATITLPKKSFHIPPFCVSFMLNKYILQSWVVYTIWVVISFPLWWFRKQLEELEEAHMLRGQLKATQQLALLSSHDELAQALEGAFFVQVTALPPQATYLSVSPA